jgi:protein-disulfide isomerase
VQEGLAQIAGVADFEARYDEVLEQVREDVQLGVRLSVQSTPTFFVNGIRIEGGLRPAYLDALIEAELTAADAPQPPAAD